MSPRSQRERSTRWGTFWTYLAWTILLGLVFAVGVIIGQQWTNEDRRPLVDVEASSPHDLEGTDVGTEERDAADPSSTASASDATAAPPVEFSFYDRLSRGRSPSSVGASGSPYASESPSPPSPPAVDASLAGRRGASSHVGEQDATDSARYTLQVSAHRTLDLAERRMEALHRKGLEPYLVTTELADEGTYYRVRLGRFESMEEARKFQEAIRRKRGVDASVMPL